MPAPGTSGKMPHSKNNVTGARNRMANSRQASVSGSAARKVAMAALQPAAWHST